MNKFVFLKCLLWKIMFIFHLVSEISTNIGYFNWTNLSFQSSYSAKLSWLSFDEWRFHKCWIFQVNKYVCLFKVFVAQNYVSFHLVNEISTNIIYFKWINLSLSFCLLNKLIFRYLPLKVAHEETNCIVKNCNFV